MTLPALTLGGVLLLYVSSCSVPKRTVEQRLLAMPAHEPLRAQGLQRLPATMRLEGELEEVLLTWVRFLPRDGRPAGERPSVVLVHGTPGSLFGWLDVALSNGARRGLAEDFDVYAFDVIGHGSTRGGGAPMTFQRGADFVAGAIEVLGLSDVALVGHSYGGELCWRAALDRPDLIASLVLIDSSGYPREPGGFLSEEVLMRESRLAKLGYLLNSRSRIAHALRPHFAEPLSATRIDALYHVCGNRENWRAMVELARDEEGWRAMELPRLAMPVLLVWGENDIAYPAATVLSRFERDLVQSRSAVIAGAGHYPHEECPEEVLLHLREFLREL